MSDQTNDKVRIFANAVTFSATATYPGTSFPTSRDPDLFIGDMKGAEVSGISWLVASATGAGTIDGKIQHSADGTNWSDVTTDFTQLAADGAEFVDLTAEPLLRYIRFVVTKGGTFGCTLTLRAHFKQTGAKGRYAPPGYSTKPTA